MRNLLTLAFLVCVAASRLCAQQHQPTSANGHYLFVWSGDAANQGNDFLAVIDADPASSSYGHLITTLATDQKTELAHHTEYAMPASGMLFANDHLAGRTFIFKATPKGFDLVGDNKLGDEVLSTPAICGNRIYMRVAIQQKGQRQEMLYCLGKSE